MSTKAQAKAVIKETVEWRAEDRRKILEKNIENVKGRIEERAQFFERSAQEMRNRLATIGFGQPDPDIENETKDTINALTGVASYIGGSLMNSLRIDLLVADTERLVKALADHKKAQKELEDFNSGL